MGASVRGVGCTDLDGGLASLVTVGGRGRWGAPVGRASGCSRGTPVHVLGADQGGQVMCALTAVAFPAVTVAVATPGWQPGRLAVTV